MANIGDILLQPEEGWKRYDDNDVNIEYINMETASQSNAYNGSYHHNNKDKNNAIIKFNFIGDKLRIFGVLFNRCGTDNIEITLDGKNIILFGQYSTESKYCVLNCEVNNLSYREHFIQIRQLDDKSIYLDAIDIDVNGELKPYNEKIYKFLLKQSNQYYTIKSHFYNGKTYTPCTKDFPTNGFEDLNGLIQSVENVERIGTKDIVSEVDVFRFNIGNYVNKIEVM